MPPRERFHARRESARLTGRAGLQAFKVIPIIVYRVYPDGPSRLSWPGIMYVRVRPTWIRYSDYNVDPPLIVEFTAGQLAVQDST